MAKGINLCIHTFAERYGAQLPGDALSKISEFIDELPFESEGLPAYLRDATAVAHFSAMARRFRAEFNYLVSDLDFLIVRRTARAFSHLQRSIIADKAIRDKWIAAEKHHEIACEKLGAVHLLLHGVWSFKVSSEGERTDLVLGEPLRDDDITEVYLSAEGLVLTEWKMATPSNRKQKYQEALAQAELYSKGSLATIKLEGYRYLVIVSSDFLEDLPDDIAREEIVYKYVNIAVDPSTPSKRARAKHRT